jgi:hypothetical protein
MSVEQAPSIARRAIRNQRLEGWKDKTEAEIFDDSVPSLAEVLASVSKRYGPGMSPAEWSMMMASVAGSYVLNNLNRKPLVQQLRQRIGIPLPDPSQIYRPTPEGMEQQALLHWEAYMTKLDKSDRFVIAFHRDQYNFDDPNFVPHIIHAIIKSSVTTNTTAYHSLMPHVHDPSVPERLPFRRKKFQNNPLDIPTHNILYIHKSGMAQYIEIPFDDPMNVMDSITTEVHYNMNDSYPSLEVFLANGKRDVQVVIDASGQARSQGTFAADLVESATVGVDLVPDTGELIIGIDHLPADGRPIVDMEGKIPNILTQYAMGEVARPRIDFRNGTHIELFSGPHEKKQVVSLEDMPDLSYTDASFALLLSLHEQEATSLTDEPSVRRPRLWERFHAIPRPRNKVMSGLATLNYPVELTGDRYQDNAAQQVNRTSVFAATSAMYAPLLSDIQLIRDAMKAQNPYEWRRNLEYDPALIRNYVPAAVWERMIERYRLSAGMLRTDIDDARRDRGVMELVNLYYGAHMDQKVADFAERIMPDRIIALMHGDAVHTRIDFDTLLRVNDKPGYFTTITPKGPQQRSGKIVLSTLRAIPLTARRGALQLARARGDTRSETHIYTEALLNYLNSQGTELTDENAASVLGSMPDLLNIKTTHMLAWEDRDPVVARRRVIEFAARLTENWIVMSALKMAIKSA